MQKKHFEWRIERNLLAPILTLTCEADDNKIEWLILKQAVKVIEVAEKDFKGKSLNAGFPKSTKNLCVSFSIKFQSDIAVSGFTKIIPNILSSA